MPVVSSTMYPMEPRTWSGSVGQVNETWTGSPTGTVELTVTFPFGASGSAAAGSAVAASVPSASGAARSAATRPRSRVARGRDVWGAGVRRVRMAVLLGQGPKQRRRPLLTIYRQGRSVREKC
jgi:hypothetical protein